MATARRYRVWIFVALIVGAFGLRLYRIDAVPLRGDEAFTVRYWAAPPQEVVRTMVERDHEPHPMGTFLAFWAWKSAVGDTPFAMRYLPALASLVGMAAAGALARRLTHDDRLAWVVAALWAIHPFEIWHAQDVRNYALWAAASVFALALFVRASASRQRHNWVPYIAAEWVALNTFFFEVLFLPVQLLYLLMFHRTRIALRRALGAWAVLAVLLIPWFIQVGSLITSGYKGTLEKTTLPHLFTRFLPELLIGDTPSAPWGILLSVIWMTLVAWLWLKSGYSRRLGLWLAGFILLPTILLAATGTRMSVFNPRYVLPMIPALLLLTSVGILPHRSASPGSRFLAPARMALVAVPVFSVAVLLPYYRGDNPKAPDWPALAAYLEGRAGPHDIIVQVTADPSFRYYYRGPSEETSLVPGEDVIEQLRDKVAAYPAIWLVGRQPQAEQFLSQAMQSISFDQYENFVVTQYRQTTASLTEIATPLTATFGDVARLRGYTLQGPDTFTRATTLLLFWDPLVSTTTDYKVFVHLIGAPNPDNAGSTLWDQDDHPPLYGSPGTRDWQPGTLYRDQYHLLVNPAVRLKPGVYTLELGLYDPVTGDRLPVASDNNTSLGDSLTLGTLSWPPQ